MRVTARTTDYRTERPAGAPPRAIRGVVLHHTGGSTPVRPHAQGSWHWLVDLDGTLYADVPEEDVAWHTRACDRARPEWVMLGCLWANASDVNTSTIGIELVGLGGGAPMTSEQHVALAELAGAIQARHGDLWWVGHGEVQADRRLDEPAGLDWEHAGFGLKVDGFGRRWNGGATTMDEKAILHAIDATAYPIGEVPDLIRAAAGWRANAGSLSGWIEEIGALRSVVAQRDARIAELEAQVAAAGYDPTLGDGRAAA